MAPQAIFFGSIVENVISYVESWSCVTSTSSLSWVVTGLLVKNFLSLSFFVQNLLKSEFSGIDPPTPGEGRGGGGSEQG